MIEKLITFFQSQGFRSETVESSEGKILVNSYGWVVDIKHRHSFDWVRVFNEDFKPVLQFEVTDEGLTASDPLADGYGLLILRLMVHEIPEIQRPWIYDFIKRQTGKVSSTD